MLAPIFEEASETCADNAAFFEVNVDDNKDFAKSLGLQNIPTIICYANGEQKETHVGMMSEDDIKNKVKSL